MKINEFIEMYKKNRNIDLKRVLEVADYISMAHKQKMVELVLDACMVEENGVLKINSLDRYLLFTIATISTHTNLEFADEENEEYSAINDFDELSKNHLLDKVIDTFRDDYNACQIVLDMMTSDKISNHETLEKKLCRLLHDLSESIKENFSDLENKKEILGILGSMIEE